MSVSSADDAPGGGLASGTEVGPYRITGLIGRGGMGVVYEARHLRVGQRAALKLLSPARRAEVGDAAVRRFLAEVDTLSRLEHPGLVRILDCGEAPAHGPWLAMEYVAGEGLRARLDRAGGGLPLAAAVRLARRIASAVAAIHGAGVVHRDLKPDNIMVTPDDEVPGGERIKLLDFGIAKLADGDGRHTTEGTVLGTAGYMAPEQCTGERDLDDRADVYALGVIVFELVTGARPFAGANLEVMRQHLFAEPPLERLAAAPDRLRELVRVMLAKEPTRRPAIAAVVTRLRAIEAAIAGAPEAEPASSSAEPALGDTLPARALSAPTLAARPAAIGGAASTLAPVIRTDDRAGPRPRRRRRGPWLIAGAGALAAAAVVTWRLARPRAPDGIAARPGMAVIEGARFRMGSTEPELTAGCALAFGGCEPAARKTLERELFGPEVTVSRFQIDVREVTNREYAAFLNVRTPELTLRDDRDDHYPRFVDELSTGRTLINLERSVASIVGERRDGGRQVSFTVKPGRDELPVDGVTWDGATRYCRDQGKRLPTEAEWELAARGPERRVFPWGAAPPFCGSVVFGREDPAGCPTVRAVLEPVGTGAQDVTRDGVHDLGGSVAEWIQDSFVTYGDCGACRDPLVDVNPPFDEDVRVVRGGSFVSAAWTVRTTTRSRNVRKSGLYGLGFRCATR